MTIRDYLDGVNPEQYHIFDSHQEGMADRGVDHQDRDYEAYSYNVHKNNRPKPGDVFLYRRPGKSTANRKFNIYGGGVIAEITEPDREGNVLAAITSAFRLKEPIEQGDPRIESFEWTSKEKTPGSWAHFWSQYGMNVIDQHDFYGLVGDLEYVVPGNTNPWGAGVYEASEAMWSPATGFDVKGFHVDIVDDGEQRADPASQESEARTLTGRHVDFEKVQKANASVGKAGELLVLEMLQEQYAHSFLWTLNLDDFDIASDPSDSKEVAGKEAKCEYDDGVYHKDYGKGIVVKQTTEKVYVDFSGKQRIFSYPEAFEKEYLKLLYQIKLEKHFFSMSQENHTRRAQIPIRRRRYDYLLSQYLPDKNDKWIMFHHPGHFLIYDTESRYCLFDGT